MLHGKRAISELVAALILISIAMAGAIIVYVYSSGLLGSLQGAQPQQSYSARVSLEYYDWTIPAKLNITLRNTGSEVVNFAEFFIGNGTWNMKVANNQVTYGPGCSDPAHTLSIQSSCKVTLGSPSQPLANVTPGTAYTVKVISGKGAIFSYSVIAGSLKS